MKFRNISTKPDSTQSKKRRTVQDPHNPSCKSVLRDAGSLDLLLLPLLISMKGFERASERDPHTTVYETLQELLQPLLDRLYAYEGGHRDTQLGMIQERPGSRDDFMRILSGETVGATVCD